METDIKKLIELEEETTQAEQVEKVQAEDEQRQELRAGVEPIKPIVNKLHNLVIVDILNKDVEPAIIDEMSECFLLIIDKYLPQVDFLGKYGAEIAYAGLIGAVLMSPDKKGNQEIKENE